jgi:DNA-binding transcriptional regulator GbsR (MarR family)
MDLFRIFYFYNMSLNLDFITPVLLEEIPYFENFLDRIGFKRLDGAVFGLLVLSSRPLCSEEIEKALALSQSAVSQSLKSLTHFGALELSVRTEEIEGRSSRVKYHTAKDNALNIVASVFRKREHESILEFKSMAKRSMEKCFISEDINSTDRRWLRLSSILATCQLAEDVIEFVYNLAQIDNQETFRQVVSRVPKAFNLMLTTGQASSAWASKLKGNIKEGIFDGLAKWGRENSSKERL